MDRLKQVILSEIQDLTDSGLDMSNAIDIVAQRHFTNYYQEALKLKEELIYNTEKDT